VSAPHRPDRPLPWPRLGSRPGPDLHLFRARWDQVRHPVSGRLLTRLVLETPDWVNVVALTPAREVVLVRQHRFGVERVTTEIPGGAVHHDEGHEEAARRELREETGYTAERWSYLGACEPNPAFHDNLCHHWLAEDARPTHPTEWDEGEDLLVLAVPEAEVRAAVRRGDIRHALALTALARVIDLGRGPAGR
jgi:8-oxo-dGTP pyrophosphatase MutT (NUDIX family)